MRKQWVCSECGFPCSSTCRSLNVSIPEILKACRLKESDKKVFVNELSLMTKNNLLTDDQISSPSSSIAHQNVAFSVGEIGMIFGNCTSTKSVLDIKLKSEVLVTADDDNFCCGKTSKPSSTIQIKQEYERVEEGKNEAIWDSKKVKKKKRSKLPEYRRRRRRLVVGPKYDDVLIYEKWMSIPENEIGLGAELLLQMSPAAALPSSTSTSTYIN